MAPQRSPQQAAARKAHPFDIGLCIATMASTMLYCCSERGRAALSASMVPHSSDIDWCEDNYAYSEHVAEFWNTLTSTFMLPVAAGVLLMVVKLGHFQFRPQALFLVFGLLGISLGSVYFHTQARLPPAPFRCVLMLTVCVCAALSPWADP